VVLSPAIPAWMLEGMFGTFPRSGLDYVHRLGACKGFMQQGWTAKHFLPVLLGASAIPQHLAVTSMSGHAMHLAVTGI
jgi:hypothetical protein